MSVGECPRHAGQAALAQCARCGRPACGYCLPDSGTVCADCVAADEGQAAFPWERTDLGMATRFARTLGAVFTRPSLAFEKMPEAPATRAFVFATLVWFLASILSVLVAAPVVYTRSDALGAGMLTLIFFAIGMPILMLLFGWALILVSSGVFHVVAAMAGSRSGFSGSLRAVCYAQAFALCLPLFWVAGAPLGIGGLVLGIGFLIMAAHLAVVLAAVARGLHGLSGGRVLAASIAAPAVLLTCAASLILGVVVMMDAAQADQSPGQYAAPIAE